MWEGFAFSRTLPTVHISRNVLQLDSLFSVITNIFFSFWAQLLCYTNFSAQLSSSFLVYCYFRRRFYDFMKLFCWQIWSSSLKMVTLPVSLCLYPDSATEHCPSLYLCLNILFVADLLLLGLNQLSSTRHYFA